MESVLSSPEQEASTHTTGRKSARSTLVEVITRGERRRVWPIEQKREIVAESLEPGLTATGVARKYGISSGQLYTWRRQLLNGPKAALTRAVPQFAQVELTPVQGAPNPESTPAALPPSGPTGLIEILLPGGVSVRVDGGVNSRALRRVLAVLQVR